MSASAGIANYVTAALKQAEEHLEGVSMALEQHLRTDFVKAGEDMRALKVHIEAEIARLKALL